MLAQRAFRSSQQWALDEAERVYESAGNGTLPESWNQTLAQRLGTQSMHLENGLWEKKREALRRTSESKVTSTPSKDQPERLNDGSQNSPEGCCFNDRAEESRATRRQVVLLEYCTEHAFPPDKEVWGNAGISESSFYKWKHARRVGQKTLGKLASVLGVSPEQIA